MIIWRWSFYVFFYNINSKSSGKKMEEKEKAAYHILWQHPVNFSKRKSLNFLRLRTANGKTLLVLCVHQNTSYTFATWSSVFIKPHFHSLTLVSLSKTWESSFINHENVRLYWIGNLCCSACTLDRHGGRVEAESR